MASDDRRGDSPLAFVVIRGALWGIVAAVVAIVMIELLGLLATGGSSAGIATFAGGIPALATGLLAGIIVALLAYSGIRRAPHETRAKSLSMLVGTASALITFGVGLASLLWLQADTGIISTGLHWAMSIGMLVLGVCVPVAGFAIWASGKTLAGYILRFED